MVDMNDSWQMVQKLDKWRPRTDKSSRGRPPTPWTDALKRIVMDWMKTAQNRYRWKHLETTYVQQWAISGLMNEWILTFTKSFAPGLVNKLNYHVSCSLPKKSHAFVEDGDIFFTSEYKTFHFRKKIYFVLSGEPIFIG